MHPLQKSEERSQFGWTGRKLNCQQGAIQLAGVEGIARAEGEGGAEITVARFPVASSSTGVKLMPLLVTNTAALFVPEPEPTRNCVSAPEPRTSRVSPQRWPLGSHQRSQRWELRIHRPNDKCGKRCLNCC